MTNLYLELKKKHQEKVNNFPMFFAFSDSQFEEGMKSFGLNPGETNKIVSIGGGGYILKADIEAYNNMGEYMDQGMKSAINDDITGEQFIFDMFNYELANHEYNYTQEFGSTLEALGFTYEEIQSDERLLNGLKKACEHQRESDY